MKKIILPALLLVGMLTNAQGTKGVFTYTTPNQTFADNAARVAASMVLSAGPLTQGSASVVRTLNFMDLPVSNFDANPTIWFSLNNRNDYTRMRFVAVQNANSEFVLMDKTQTTHFEVIDDVAGNAYLRMPKANSFVTIGTNSFSDGAEVYRLSVNGNMRARRVKVYTTWADYVFEKDYKLPTLEEVEQHIKEKGHLQDIPSAKEVEANGIELGEMNKLLLQKIEELTLYMIDHKKENEKQSQLIKQLEEKVKELSENK